MVKLEQNLGVDVNKLRSADELKGKIRQIFPPEEILSLVEKLLIPHYILNNPLNGTKMVFFSQDEVNRWISAYITKYNCDIEPKLTFIHFDYAGHEIAAGDIVPPALCVIKFLYKLPLEHNLNTPPGIYFLCAGDELKYIGQAKNIGSRIREHRPDKDFDSVFFINCHSNFLNQVETALIRFFKPCHNIAQANKNVSERDAEILGKICEF